MKVTGIIAEFNPFHNGHRYLLQESRKKTGADYCIVIMSGSFVQRGAPAIQDKFTRTRCALENGADLVLELPVTGVCQNAESFAGSGVGILDSLGVVTDLAFGCEESAGESSLLQQLAVLFCEEPEDFRTLLGAYLKKGLSYPAARCLAACDFTDSDRQRKNQIREILQLPNATLAIEYRKALYRLSSGIRPCMILRKGSSHHEDTQELLCNVQSGFASASAIRSFVLQQNAPEICRLKNVMPESAYFSLIEQQRAGLLLQENDFSELLHYKLLEILNPALTDKKKISDDLLLRIRNRLEEFTDWTSFAALVKTRNRTLTAVNRQFVRLLLDIPTGNSRTNPMSLTPYARILGFRKEASPLLKEIRQKSSIPVLTSVSDALKNLPVSAVNSLKKDILASDIRRCVLTEKTKAVSRNDLRQPLVIV